MSGLWNIMLYTGVFVLTFGFSDGESHGIQTSCGNLPTENSTIVCAMCQNSLYSWYEGNFPYNTSSDAWTRELPFEKNSASWENICRWGNDVATAISANLQSCPSSVGVDVLTSPDSYWLLFNYPDSICGVCGNDMHESLRSWNRILTFYRRICEKDRLKPHINQLLMDPMFDNSLQCVDANLHRNVRRCLGILTDDYRSGVSKLNWMEPDGEKNLHDLASSILSCTFSVINRSPCNPATKEVLYQLMRVQLPIYLDDRKVKANESTTEDFRSKLRCTVGVYGDPHFKTCWSESLVTCSLPGLQTYFSNKYLIIKGDNQAIGQVTSPRATTLKSVSITFLSIDGDMVIGTYSVSSGKLSKVFDNSGGRSAGTGHDAVQVYSDPYDRIRFVQRGTGAVLILGQWAGNYFFTLRLAENVMVGSSGLLVDGCPDDHILTLESVISLPERSVSQSDCILGCNQVDHTLEQNIHTCVKDCLITGQLDFATNMTTGAIQDGKLVMTYDETLIKGAYQTGSPSGSQLVLVSHILIIAAIRLTRCVT